MAEDVQILAVQTIHQPLVSGQIAEFHEVQYSALGVPIRRVIIPAELDSNEERARRIAEDLRSARVTEPTRLTLPD